ncbi:MAG TPA: TonB-dependent receptor plug domain-containing protein [Steroidobacteraceae bacterium]|nr:TonB-dependent receptor plug domain-containing protein [Steroidobacteraceae bacterium]
MRRFATRQSGLAALAVASLLAVPAWAQESAAEGGDKLAEIIVTAQKREQNLQDVGTSVTAFDGPALQQLGLKNVTDVASQVPGLQYNQYGATVTIYNLRGVSQNDFSDHQEAPVAVYADDAYIASTGALAGSLFDLQRVEVLRGPQGTLFGRNATGGLIQYVSAAPTDTPEGHLEISGGNFGTVNSEGAISGPLTDILSARLSFATADHNGYITNRVGPDVNNQKQYAARLQFRLKLGDKDEIRVKLHALNNDHEIAGNYSWAAATPNSQGRGVFAPPGTPDMGGYVNTSTSPFDQAEDREGLFNRTVWGANVRGTFHLPGDITLVSVTDYLKMQKRYGEDSDVSPNYLFNYDTGQHYQQFSEELRLNGAIDNFRWITGLYYLNYFTRNFETTQLPTVIDGFEYGDGFAKLKLNDSSPSVFAQVEYDFTSQLTGIVGARYTSDDKTYTYDYTCVVCPQTLSYSPATYPAASKNFSIPTGKVELDYKPVHDVLVYGSVNRGAKGGGWSAPSSGGVDPSALPYKQEKLTSYELGFKSTFLDGAARLNGALFYYDYRDYQGFFLDVATQVVENINAKVKGGELEFAVVPTHGLNLQLGVSHLETAAYNVPTPAGDLLTTNLPQAPHWSLNAVAHYQWPLFGGQASVEADAKWNGAQYLELVNNPDDYEPAYILTNARVGFMTGDGHWDFTAYVNNLADRYYRIYNLDLSGFLGIDQAVYGPPRTFGATVRYSWGP